MIGKSSSQNQQDIFNPLLKEFINLNHELGFIWFTNNV